MADALLSPLREGWAAVQDRLFFLPPFPDHFDVLATVSLLLILGLLAGEWLQARLRWPRMIGYVLAGAVLGPRLLTSGWAWRTRTLSTGRRQVFALVLPGDDRVGERIDADRRALDRQMRIDRRRLAVDPHP